MSTPRRSSGTTGVSDALRLDEARLARWMAEQVPNYQGPLTIEQFRGGQSNPTYTLLTPHQNYVLRRKPPGQLLPGAHAVEREARVLQALEKVSFPVAHVYGLCTDASVLGTWFYVMEHVEGRIFWDATFPGVVDGFHSGVWVSLPTWTGRCYCLRPILRDT
jgi:aminoglycoside phosphotransferase (APT) family kinase protein